MLFSQKWLIANNYDHRYEVITGACIIEPLDRNIGRWVLLKILTDILSKNRAGTAGLLNNHTIVTVLYCTV
jgi:hypothetical protein